MVASYSKRRSDHIANEGSDVARQSDAVGRNLGDVGASQASSRVAARSHGNALFVWRTPSPCTHELAHAALQSYTIPISILQHIGTHISFRRTLTTAAGSMPGTIAAPDGPTVSLSCKHNRSWRTAVLTSDKSPTTSGARRMQASDLCSLACTMRK